MHYGVAEWAKQTEVKLSVYIYIYVCICVYTLYKNIRKKGIL